MNSRGLVDPSKPAFSMVEDELEDEFLSSSNPFASNNFGKAYDPAKEEMGQTIHQIRKVEQSSLDSTKRCLQSIAESEQMGVETAKNLVHQREQLENTSKRLDMMNEDLKESQKNISAMKSVFTSFRQWMTKDKNPKAKSNSISSPSEYGDPNFDHNPALEKAVNIAPQGPDPSLRIRGIDYDNSSSGRYEGPLKSPQDSDPQDWRATTKKVDKQIDDDLDEMSFGLSRLAGLAHGLNTELTQQNELVERVGEKAAKTDIRLGTTNKNLNSLLKK